MQKISKKTYLLSLLPAIAMMIIIFLFSAKTAAESNGSSSWIANRILLQHEKFAGSMSEYAREEVLGSINHLIRKAAHMTEFMLLALLMGYHFIKIRCSVRSYFVRNLVICIFYAMTDEFHQLFVEGRSGQLSDVGIDAVGVVIGTILLYILMGKHFKEN